MNNNDYDVGILTAKMFNTYKATRRVSLLAVAKNDHSTLYYHVFNCSFYTQQEEKQGWQHS